jgi:thioredoxin-related protein
MFFSLRPSVAVIAVVATAMVAAFSGSLAAQDVRFAHDYAAARREALEKHRPIVVVLGTDNCVWCRKLESTTLRDPAIVQALSDRFVVVHIEADRDPTISNALGVTGYPTIVFANPEGKILGKHDGYVDAARFRQQLDRALRESGPSSPSAPAAPASLATLAAPVAAVPGSLSIASAPAASAPAASAPAASASGGPAPDRLLAQAKEDLRAGQPLGCLERCRRIASNYPDAPEAAEAKRLVAEITADSKTQTAATEMLCEVCLARAGAAMTQGLTREAAALFEQVRLLSPGSPLATTAEASLAQLRSTEPRIRAQAP